MAQITIQKILTWNKYEKVNKTKESLIKEV